MFKTVLLSGLHSSPRMQNIKGTQFYQFSLSWLCQVFPLSASLPFVDPGLVSYGSKMQ